MALDFFGAGALFATPTYDATGTAIALPSPVQIGILQNVTIDDSADVKELYGANQYPVDIGRGKGKISIKASFAQFSAELFNAVYYGQGYARGSFGLVADVVGSTVPTGAGATAVNIVATGGASALFVADLGVQDGNGIPFTRVASAPTGYQYALVTGVSSSGATYQFSNVDVGRTVFINYQYSNAALPALSQNLTIQNIAMGQVPVFSAQFYATRNGQKFWRKFPACVANKLSMGWKNDDFVIPDFEFSAFADTNNTVQVMSVSG